jgi:hypothetical protein
MTCLQFNQAKRATRELLVSLPSRAKFHFWTRLLNESSRANSLVDRALASRAELARLGLNSSPTQGYSTYGLY